MFESVCVFFHLVSDPSTPNVQVTRMSLICESAPNPLVLDLQGESLFTQFYAAKMEIIYLLT